MKLKTLPIFLAFFAMGFADAVGPLAGTIKFDPQFQFSGFMVGLLPAFTFIAFAVPLVVFVYLLGLALTGGKTARPAQA